MRQPVAAILVLAEAALSESSIPTAARARLAEVREQAAWLGDLLQCLLEPPSPGTADRESHDLAAIASGVVEGEQATYDGELRLGWSGGKVGVLGNATELRRAIANLLSNATRAAGPRGKVAVELHSAGDRVLLTVDDSGPGFGLIRRGSGLGLRAVARGLKSCGGSIEYGRSRLGGTRALLVLRASAADRTECPLNSSPPEQGDMPGEPRRWRGPHSARNLPGSTVQGRGMRARTRREGFAFARFRVKGSQFKGRSCPPFPAHSTDVTITT